MRKTTPGRRTFLHDAIDIVSMGSHAVENDDFTRCFQPMSEAEMYRSGVFYSVSFLIRYFFLFPARFLFLCLCSIIFLLLIFRATITGSTTHLEGALMFIMKAVVVSINARIRHVGKKKRLYVPHVYVANHTSFVDFILLSSHKFPHTCVSEDHGGLFGFLFKLILMRNGSISFKRSERVDRKLVAKKLKSHVMSGGTPMLIFPEGTCMNNRFSVLFQKGVFDLGVTIFPVAIRFKKDLSDPYWNRRKHGFSRHMFYLMTRWRLEAEVSWMESVTMMSGETPTQFSHRTKVLISRKAGLRNTLWNGAFKSTPIIKDREMLGEAYIITYGRLVTNTFDKSRRADMESGRSYLQDDNIDTSSVRDHVYFESCISYKEFQNEILKEYLRLKEFPPEELKFLLSSYRSRGHVLWDRYGKASCNCNWKKNGMGYEH